MASVPKRVNSNTSAGWRILNRVEDQIVEGPLHLKAIETGWWTGFVLGSDVQRESPGDRELPVVFDRVFQEGHELDVRKLGLAGLGHGEEIAQQRVQPADLLQDCL
jgi:hypothetical protein